MAVLPSSVWDWRLSSCLCIPTNTSFLIMCSVVFQFEIHQILPVTKHCVKVKNILYHLNASQTCSAHYQNHSPAEFNWFTINPTINCSNHSAKEELRVYTEIQWRLLLNGCIINTQDKLSYQTTFWVWLFIATTNANWGFPERAVCPNLLPINCPGFMCYGNQPQNLDSIFKGVRQTWGISMNRSGHILVAN